VLAACSAPTDTVIPADVAQWDTQLAPALQKLSPGDRELVGQYLMRAKLGEVFGGKGMPVGMTVGGAINEQRKFVAEQQKQEAAEQALKQKLEAERAQAAVEMNKAVTVTLLEKTQEPRNFEARRYSDTQVIKIGVKNTSSKALAGVSGELEFIDIFGKTVGSVTFKISEDIAPGGEYVWVGSRRYNEFIDEQRAVWNLEDGKYKTRFVPGMLVYADGTSLAAPQ
jgi:type II secretory pathway pseudopilin PulG